MSLLFLILSFATTLSFLAWMYILLHPFRPWDFFPVGDDGPPPALPVGFAWPSVVILVPARNEAGSLPHTLPALLKQDYPGNIKIILIDDRSTDKTAEVAQQISVAYPTQAQRLTVLRGALLPKGPDRWMGKVWAMHQGAQVAMSSGAQYFLLTDADIFHEPQSLARLVAESLTAKLALNSRMARLRCVSPAEKLLIPPFVFFFNLLYPMRRVRNPNDPLAGSAGGCVLLSREALEKIGSGFECIRSEIIDDVNLARQVKAKNLPIALSLSRTEVVSLREYPHVGDIWKMVSRTAFTELKYSWARLFGAMLGLGLIFIAPLVAVWAGLLGLMLNLSPEVSLFATWALIKGLLALGVMKFVFSPAIKFFNLPKSYAWTLPFAGVIYGLMTLDSARRHASGLGLKWREAEKRKKD